MSHDPLRPLGGILLVLFGLCLLLVSGLCTILILTNLREALTGGGVMVLITLGTLAIAILAIYQGTRMLSGPKE